MYKLFTVVLALVVSSAFAEYIPFDDLQTICDVVENMNYVTLCKVNYTIKVQEKNPRDDRVTLTFETTEAGSDTTGICDCVLGYMYKAVGTEVTANAICTATPTLVRVVYEGAYDPALESLAPLKKLKNAIKSYTAPDLGGWICSQETYESESGWVYIKIKTPYDGNRCNYYGDFRDICEDISDYLIQGNFLAKSKRKCSRRGENVILDIWADE